MSDKHEEYVKRLDKIEKDLSWIIQHLLKKDEPFQTTPYLPSDPNKYKTHCVKCGMSFEGAISYWCPEPTCPTFTKTTL